MAKKPLQLINPSGTVVTLTKDVSEVNADRHVFYIDAEQDFRDANYRDVTDDDVIAPQHWEADQAQAASSDSFAARAVPAGLAVDAE